MNSRRLSYLLCFFAITFLLAISCRRSDFPGYKKDKQGLHYKSIVYDNNGQKPEIGDYLTLALVYRNAKDSVLFNSNDMRGGFRIPCREPHYPGDFFYALLQLHLNDSMAFVISADSFFLKTVGMPELPLFVEAGDFLFFDAKLINIMLKAEFEKEQKQLIQKQQESIKQMKQQEIDDLNEYLENNNIGLQPTESGLYYIEIRKGKGKEVNDGSIVKVHYSGVFLDGRKFDSSYDRKTAVEFEIGDPNILPGWNEGVRLMKEGGKAVLIVPSEIGYGAQGRDNIPPYKTLVFEIELLEVK